MPSAIDKFRWQIPLICGLVLLAQLAVAATLSPEDITRATTINSLVVAMVGTGASLVIYRQMRVFPGAFGLAYLIPSFVSCYAISLLAMFVLRLPYSNVLLLIAFTTSIVIAWMLAIRRHHNVRQTLHVVPSKATRNMVAQVGSVNWVMLKEPVLPATARYALVADLRADFGPGWECALAKAAISGMPVYHYKQALESLTGRVEIDHLSENNFGSLIPNHFYATAKRLFDLLAAAIILVVAAIPMVIVAIAIRQDSSGPVLFRQQRMGYRGEPFTIYKFRTMVPAREAPDDAAARAAAVTQADDVRVTRLGRFLRRSRLDELPQLWNVLRGDMSLIGPRPEAMSLSSWYEAELPYYGYRHIVRPGITGWAQVNQGHVAALDDVLVKLHYDFYYIKHFSAWLDILITLRTIGIVITGTGAK